MQGQGYCQWTENPAPAKNAVQDMWGATANVKNIKHGALVQTALYKRKSASQAKNIGLQHESTLLTNGSNGETTGGRNRGAENGKFQEENINQQGKTVGQG